MKWDHQKTLKRAKVNRMVTSADYSVMNQLELELGKAEGWLWGAGRREAGDLVLNGDRGLVLQDDRALWMVVVMAAQ